MTEESSEPIDPLAGCQVVEHLATLTGPGTEYGFIEVPRRRKDLSGWYYYYQCRFRKVVRGRYVYCTFCPRSDHFTDGHHTHKIKSRQQSLTEMMIRAPEESPSPLEHSPHIEIYDAPASFAADANLSLQKAVGPKMCSARRALTATDFCDDVLEKIAASELYQKSVSQKQAFLIHFD